MTRSGRDELFLKLLHSIPCATTYELRYKLYVLGESLMTEYKDLKFKQTEKELELLISEF